MRTTTAQYLGKEQITVSVRNNNASVAIVDGQPVFFQDFDSATNWGVDVQNYTSNPLVGAFAGIAKWNRSAGLNATLASAAVGEVFEAVTYGFTDAIVTRRVRATTTDSWPTIAAMTAWNLLIPETTGNNFIIAGVDPLPLPIPSGSTGQTVTPVANLRVYLVQSAGTSAGTTSSWTGASGLADTVRMKVFVRAL